MRKAHQFIYFISYDRTTTTADKFLKLYDPGFDSDAMTTFSRRQDTMARF
jgi:hypothetical protein